MIEFKEITQDSVNDVTGLKVADSQNDFVAPNVYSLAQALFYPEAWYRAIHHNGTLVGFIMLYDETLRPDPPENPEVDVWRFMIAEPFQGKGYGKQALIKIVEELRSRKCFDAVNLSYVPGNDSAVGLYKSVGFEPTGKIDDGEIVMALDLKVTA